MSAPFYPLDDLPIITIGNWAEKMVGVDRKKEEQESSPEFFQRTGDQSLPPYQGSPLTVELTMEEVEQIPIHS